MKQIISFSTILNWLNSSEMFARPSKKILGIWQLAEYYVETDTELRNITRDQLKAANEFWNIEFTPEQNYLQSNNLANALISEIKNGNWSVSKNYITLTSPEKAFGSLEFQFAIEKETLKILKKDALGRIIFFGFFDRKS